MEQRPNILNATVVSDAANRVLQALERVTEQKIYDPHRTDWLEAIGKALITYSDAFDRARVLGAAGLKITQDVVDALNTKRNPCVSQALQAAEEDWVIRTGVRFPAKEGEVISFAVDKVPGMMKRGTVLAVRKNVARALVKVTMMGDVVEHHEVKAELVCSVWDDKTSRTAVSLRHEVGYHLTVGG